MTAPGTPAEISGKHSTDGKRERAPAKGVKDSDNPTQPLDLVGKRERASAKGVKDSDIPAQFLGSTFGGRNKDILGSGKGKRERAPAQEAKDSDAPSALLDEDPTATSETLAGKRERAPAEGAMDSDIPTQSADKKGGLGDLHLSSVTGKKVVKEHAQWRR